MTNKSAADRYLITAGDFCDPFSVGVSKTSETLPLTLGFQCICECPNPGPARPGALHRLKPGESFTLTWDARALTTCTQTVDCSQAGWPNAGMATKIMGSHEPVGPNTYLASVGALTSVPQGCSSGDDTVFSCYSYPGDPGAVGPWPGPVASACPSDVSASAAFLLPVTGDVSVDIAITQ